MSYLQGAIDKTAGLSIPKIRESELAQYERTLLALLQNVESAYAEVVERRTSKVAKFFKDRGFRLSRRRMKFNHAIVYNRNITDVSFVAFISTDGGPIRYLDRPVTVHIYDLHNSKLLADMGAFETVVAAMQMLPNHYTNPHPVST